MKNIKRVFLIVLDSVGVGEAPDAAAYGDKGANTLRACYRTGRLRVPTMRDMGLFNLEGIDFGSPSPGPVGAYARMREASSGKDTTIGHWEIAGVVSPEPLPTYPDGFPEDVTTRFEAETGYRALCNKPYSGTEVLKAFGEAHLQSKSVIVYTSADSVFQIAAHMEAMTIEELYRVCEIARKILTGKHRVGRVIARPFDGKFPDFKRTSQRKDFSISPPSDTVLNALMKHGFSTIGVGKIGDIFSGSGISKSIHTKSNRDGMEQTAALMKENFTGLCFTNLVDFDMIYGHRNDVAGYTNALNEFDVWLGGVLPELRDTDILAITADHGCDPTTQSSDHSREYAPLLIYGKRIRKNINLGTRDSFADVGKTIADIFRLEAPQLDGVSMLGEIM